LFRSGKKGTKTQQSNTSDYLPLKVYEAREKNIKKKRSIANRKGRHHIYKKQKYPVEEKEGSTVEGGTLVLWGANMEVTNLTGNQITGLTDRRTQIKEPVNQSGVAQRRKNVS